MTRDLHIVPRNGGGGYYVVDFRLKKSTLYLDAERPDSPSIGFCELAAGPRPYLSYPDAAAAMKRVREREREAAK